MELFAGAGGLTLALARSGFAHETVIENDSHCCETLNANRALLAIPEIEPRDVHDWAWPNTAASPDLLAAGVPCQPFSLGGLRAGRVDNRNLFPEVFRAVRALVPKVVLIENVSGLASLTLREYLDYVLRQLALPERRRRPDESWVTHSARLRNELASSRWAIRYVVNHAILDSADFGAAQRRKRVYIVAVRSDLGFEWVPPDATHSRDRLIYAQWLSGDYWAQFSRSIPDRIPEELRTTTARLRESPRPKQKRWRTVADIVLPRDSGETRSDRIPRVGARTYIGHTGSSLHWPSKTLKAGVHGVPGGENVLVNQNGSVRYFSAREAARLQTFPERYQVSATWSEAFRQLGNAVTVNVGQVLGAQLAADLTRTAIQRRIS